MNRSILIVICDFLVLCALSLSSGLSERPAQLSPPIPGFHYTSAAKAGSKSAVAMEDYQKLQQEAEALKKQLAQTREKSGRESQRMNQELAEKASKLFKTEQELAAAAAALAREKKLAAEKSSDLKRTQQNMQELKDVLSAVKDLAVERGKDVEHQRKQLESARQDLRQRDSELARTRVVFSAKERELALANQQIGSLKKDAARTSADLSNLQKRLDSERDRNRKAGQDMAQLQARLAGMTEQSRNLQRNLALTRKQLADTEELLRSRSIEKYLSSVVRLDTHIVNIRPLLGRHVYDAALYLPEIRLGNRIWIPGVLQTVAGLDQKFSGHTRVSELSYTVSQVKGAPGKTVLSSPFFIPDAAPQICLIPVKQSTKAPLNVLSFSGLKSRGLRDLTLFKKNSMGTATAELAERCSFDNTHGTNYLLIRNSLRNSTQLAAEPGDVIITKEGFLAAVVIGLSGEKDGYRYAFGFVFPDQPLRGGNYLPVVKKNPDPNYTDFVRLTEEYRKKAETHLKEKVKKF